METKKCNGECGLEKTLDCFGIRNDRGKLSLRGQCKGCRAKLSKKWRAENPERDKENHRRWSEKNPERKKENNKRWREENPERDRENHKIWRENNPEKIIENNRKWYEENVEIAKETSKKWREKNPERAKRNGKEWAEEKRSSDPMYRVMDNFRSAFKGWVKSCNISKNGKSTFNCLPYSFEEYKNHIESQFDYWMTFENQGLYLPKTWDDSDPTTWKWQLDHIIPQSTFILASIDDVETIKKCWALSNLRPLSAKQNQLDGATKIRHKLL